MDPKAQICSPPDSMVTTLKVYMSWCKDVKKENFRVIQLVDRLRKHLWEKGIEVFDSDCGKIDNLVGNKFYPPIIICTLAYFNDLNCLKELKFICEHLPKHLFPLFYNPQGEITRLVSDVKYGHRPILTPVDTPFNDEIEEEEEEEEEEEGWTLGAALTELSCYSRWTKDPNKDDPVNGFRCITTFAHNIWVILNPAGLDYTSLVGLESRLHHLKTQLKHSMYHVVQGPEGSGKTTLAMFLYNHFSTIRTQFHHTRMIVHPSSMSQPQLAAHIFDNLHGWYHESDVWNPEKHRRYVALTYQSWPLLIIFDNIQTAADYDHVAPVLSLLPNNGSKVVFISRDASWLTSYAPELRFKAHLIPPLDRQSSLVLFCLIAFKQNQPPKPFIKLAKKAVKMSKGVPLKLVRCAWRFCRMSEDDKAALATNEDMYRLFPGKYAHKVVLRRGGSCQSLDECTIGTTYAHNQLYQRGYNELWKKISAMKVASYSSECVM